MIFLWLAPVGRADAAGHTRVAQNLAEPAGGAGAGFESAPADNAGADDGLGDEVVIGGAVDELVADGEPDDEVGVRPDAAGFGLARPEANPRSGGFR